jgi:hypothetical protein
MRKKQTEEEKKNSYYLNKYGITYQEFKEKAKNGCEICGRKEGRLCQDHIHVSGYKGFTREDKRVYARGCLCFLCNTGIRSLERTKDGNRNRKMLEGMVKYFTVYKLKGE